MNDEDKRIFQFFNEVGIINQLASAIFSSRLADGLHISHFALLNNLVRMGDGKTPLMLANAFQVPKTTMTHTLSVLEKRGAITLAPHETDGRSKLVFLTDEGREIHAAAIHSMADPIHKMKNDLGADSFLELMPELARIRAYLDDNREI
ncbi:MAG: MarR family transcriptional regulator [Yoonia sp.]|uniref:MarR family winged helix-turn-helix transcriptional regulator n=1 Tax=Yoonia sp. TaxID=2212373 RepID=UPI00273D4048|nr:MarR family transcriptional regulator [Yoonia sp.]MDP5084079.1 MarR family transcriptional regulator [Yoonia sp.]